MEEIKKEGQLIRERVDEAILSDEETLNAHIKTIKDVMYENSSLVALSAPQLGINSRIFCIRFSNGDIRTFINPMITHSEGIHLSRESNASVEKEYIVVRNNDIQVTYQTPTGKIESNLFQGAPSEIFQQMVHILDGILISDYGLEIIDGWDEASEEERQQVIDMYLKSLKDTSEQISKEIQETPELKKINDAIEFMTGVATGEIEVEEETKQIHLNRETRRALAKITKKVNKDKK